MSGPTPVTLEVASPFDVLNRCYPNGKQGGITLDGTPPAPLGEQVALTVRVEHPARVFTLIGQLAWARHRGSRSLKECFGVDFPADDAAARRLLKFARQELGPEATRAEVRVHTNLPVKVVVGGLAHTERLVDLSHGGAFVRADELLEVGVELELHVRASMLQAIHLKGRVAWVRSTGLTGFGIVFIDDDATQRERLDKLLLKLGSS